MKQVISKRGDITDKNQFVSTRKYRWSTIQMLNISLLTLGKLSILILPSYLRDMRAILIHRHGSHVTGIRLYFLNFTLIAEKVKAHQPSCQWKWIIRFIITRQLEQNSWEHIKDDHQIIKVENDKKIIKIHTTLDVSLKIWYFYSGLKVNGPECGRSGSN